MNQLAMKNITLPLFKYLMDLRRRSSRRSRADSGFTLTEVLVSMIIASLILSGLLSLMVELLTTDARETARTETQREMQMALDYMSTDLREAVYVYDGNCMAATGDAADVCSGLLDYIPVPNNSVPVLAFWKLEELPDAIKEQCPSNDPSIPCLSGRMHTLVVYHLTRNEENNSIWQGMGRLRRFALSPYNSSGDAVPGYADPTETGFESWPLNQGQDVRDGSPSLNRSPAVTLVDFVDDRPMSEIPDLVDAGGATVECPPNYILTPSDETLTGAFSGMRNLYGCVRDEIGRQQQALANNNTEAETAFNQKVILFLRGNAKGKPGIDTANEGFMPAIQTQVLNRSVRNKSPRQF